MIESVEQWPLTSILPVKRMDENGGLPECAVLLAESPLRVYDCHLLMAAGLPMETIRLFPFTDYESAEAIVADGWKVD